MIILRRARGAVGRWRGTVTQTLDYLALGKPTSSDHGVSPSAQHASLQQNMAPMCLRVVMGKATDDTVEQSDNTVESMSSKEKVNEKVTGDSTAGSTTAGSTSSENHTQGESETEMGEDNFQNVLLAAALKHVVCTRS
jgi:hypothetical protein